jgi:hypothetical protein
MDKELQQAITLLQIPQLKGLRHKSLKEINEVLDTMPVQPIEQQPWPQFYSSCKTWFTIAHTSNDILLKFTVAETTLHASSRQTNGEVSRDNCVELFIAFESNKRYYNLEFNCLGSCKVAYGTGRHNRRLVPAVMINKIEKELLLQCSMNDNNPAFDWEITLRIPKEVFCFTNLECFDGVKADVNFFKCGDDLPEPHFLVWNMIHADKPDFHLPEFFRPVVFNDSI